MPIYRLPRAPVFPHPALADESGLLAVGGDLSVMRLLRAYQLGIFPWYEEDTPILWWSPDPRLVLDPEELKISRSLKKVIRNRGFEMKADTVFREVLKGCAAPRPNHSDGTWLTAAMQKAYNKLHVLGLAHSVETWLDGELVGGLYGVYLGKCFFGESMFSRKSDASKVALVTLADILKAQGVQLIDCQVATDHLISMGAKEISRAAFLARLKRALRFPTSRARWCVGE